MHGRRPALLALLVLLGACPAPRAPRPSASCPEGQRLLDEAAAARAAGALFRALARAEAADRACASEATRRAAAELRAELWGSGEPPAPGDAADVRAAALLRLAGDPDQALGKLRPIAARLDAAGLAELSRALAGSQHAAEARAALEQAAARAEQRHGSRGRWHWQRGSFEPIVRLAFTPDGGRLVSADREGWIRVWDLAGGYELASMRARGWPSSLDISPDGAWIAAAPGNGPVEVWEAATGKRRLEIAEDGPARFTPEGHLVVTTGKQDGLLELELPSGAPIRKIGTGWPRSIAIGRDRIYAADEDKQSRPVVVVWDRGSGRKLEERAMPAPIGGLEVTPRGELVALLSSKVLIHDAAGKLRHTLDGARAIALTPDGTRLLASDGEGGVTQLELASGRRLGHIEVGAGGVAVAAHPRAALFATAGADGISIWSLAHEERTARFGQPSAALAVAFDAEGRRLAVGAASGTASIWDLADGRVTAITPRAGAPVTGVAFGPGGVLATASAPPSPWLIGRQGGQASLDSLVAVWDGTGARRWSKDLEQLSWIGFRPGTDTLATASLVPGPNGSWMGVTLWDGKGAAGQTLASEGSGAFAWSPDGAWLAYLGEGGIALSPTDGSPGAKLAVAAERAAFQPGGGLLALADSGGLISLWDVQAREPRRVLLDEAGAAAALAWSPSGGVLTSAAGASVRLWDPHTGARLATLAAHGAVASIAFRPDGRLLAVACDDGLVELWSIADAALVVTLAMPGEGRGLVLAPDGLADGALDADDPLRWIAGDATLPGRAVWDREAVPGLLAARLARVPAEAAPRAGLPGAAPPPAPPACAAAPGEDGHPRLVSASAPDDRSLSLCVGVESYGASPARLPACFVLDLASGAFRPRAPTPREALRRYEPDPTSLRRDGARVTVCRAGACRDLTIPELAAADRYVSTAVSEDGRLVAAIADPGAMDDASASVRAVVYDVATGRRIRQLDAGEAHASLDFVGDTLLVTNTPCAGPCSSSWLVDPRTGKRLGAIGGAPGLNTSELSAARVTGDVWAFNDWDTHAIVYQDVRTGRVVRRFDHPVTCAGGDVLECGVHMLHAGGGLAIIGKGRAAGDVTLADARGRIVARHRVPACAP